MTAANGGQTLTPNPDVLAVAGMGGDVWGAYGGGATPTAQPRSPLANLSCGVRDASWVFDAKNNRVVTAGLSNASVSGKTADQAYAGDTTMQTWSAGQEYPSVGDSQL